MADPVAIRTATGRDDAALWELLRPVFRAGETYAVPRDIDREGALAFWRAPGADLWIAEAAGAALGTAYLKPNQRGGGDHVCNAGFVTHPAARGRGVATALRDHVLDAARRRGFAAMQFNFVLASNAGAIRLWARAGFATVGRLPAAFRHPDLGLVDALVMHKSLVEEP